MRAIIIANGDSPTRDEVSNWMRVGDALMCADGGGRTALAQGLRPAHVIGDFDSLSADELGALAGLGAQLHRFPTAKDETDLELALLFAARGHDDIVVLGASGGRLDQTIANVMLLAMPQLRGKRVVIANGRERTSLIAAGEPLELDGHADERVSLLPIGGDAIGVTTRGLLYPLNDDTLRFGPARGVSNVMLGTRAQVVVRAGYLLCVHEVAA